MDESIIITAHHLRVRSGQPGFVVVETTNRVPRISFLFDTEQALDVSDEMALRAHGAVPASSGPERTE